MAWTLRARTDGAFHDQLASKVWNSRLGYSGAEDSTCWEVRSPCLRCETHHNTAACSTWVVSNHACALTRSRFDINATAVTLTSTLNVTLTVSLAREWLPVLLLSRRSTTAAPSRSSS